MSMGRVKVLAVLTLLFSILTMGCGMAEEGNNQQESREISGDMKVKNNETKEPDKGIAIKNESKKKIQTAGVLKDRTICIDPGHQIKGNNDKEPVAPGSKVLKPKTTSGTAGVVTGVPEYAFNLDVALLVRDRLKENGARVVMVRETNNVDISNIERARIANDADADLTVRIHADGASDKSVRGASVLYPGAGYVKDKSMLEKSKTAALRVAKSIDSLSGAVSVKTVERNDLTGFNWSKVPVILVEMGFMSNPEEDKLMKTEKYREKMADAIVRGVIEYFK